MTVEEFTPIVPTLAGVAFATTAVVDGGNEYDNIPISSSMRTLVVITNTHATDAKTVTFTSQADQWGNTGACMNKAISVPALTTVITGVWIRSRWGAKDSPTTGDYDCTVSYQTAANMSVAVINVPNVSKD